MAKYITKRIIYMFLSLFLIAIIYICSYETASRVPVSSAAKLSIEQRESFMRNMA